ncbi:sulfotransferase domain-containing protein [Winogradskyella sp.]
MRSFNKHIIIAGSARSGTSWLAEIIALQFRYRLLFEPEHEYQTQEGHLICDKFISKQVLQKEQEEYFRRVFRNKIDNDWIAQISNRKFKMHLWPFIPKKYVIKFVRCNLSAHFMSSYFNIPLLFIIRNPYDVILSQNRVKFNWLYNLNHFKRQKPISEVLDSKYNFNWNAVDTYTEIEILALRWCLENKVVFDLHETDNSNFTIVKYEDLKSDINLFYDLCKTYDLKPLSNLEELYGRPSSKTHPKSEIRNVSKEKKDADEQALSQIEGVLKRFGVDY